MVKIHKFLLAKNLNQLEIRFLEKSDFFDA